MSTKSRKISRDSSATDRRRSSNIRSATSTPPVEDVKTEPAESASTGPIRLNGLWLGETLPDYGSITEPLSFKETEALSVSLERSRRSWLVGAPFEKFWSRPQRGRKHADGTNSRDLMSKFHDCNAFIGPHQFVLRLYSVRDETEAKTPKGKKASISSAVESPTSQPNSAIPGPATADSPSPQHPASVNNTTMNIDTISSHDEATAEGITESSIHPPPSEDLASSDHPPSEACAITPPVKPSEDIPTASEDLAPAQSDISVSGVEAMASPSSAAPISTMEPIPEPADTSQPSAPIPPPPGPACLESTSLASPQVPVAPQSATAPSPPPSLQPQPARHPNEGLIERLHALARADPQFGELMKVVASGKASPEDIRRFQTYINENRDVPLPARPLMQPPRPIGSGYRPFAPSPLKPVARTPMKYKAEPKKQIKPLEPLKAMNLVFEFREVPSVRYNFPKFSLIDEQSDGSLLVTFFALSSDPSVDRSEKRPNIESTGKPEKGSAKKKKEEAVANTDEPAPKLTAAEAKAAKKREVEAKAAKEVDPKFYTPVTMTLTGIPERERKMFITSMKPKEEVLEHMRKIVSTLTHTKDYWVYYQLNADDAELIDKVVEPIGVNHPSMKKRPWSSAKDKEREMDFESVYIKNLW
ncbi:uncharacterized protein V2V93DRAFT_212449 [Kockiozyma suomiensis]|uniref:uncharacterized protein n=1 Tax=Kockiozyma suomiensis TaxID=1337062 RepID=UPI00334300DB